jgi:hypothetical protein
MNGQRSGDEPKGRVADVTLERYRLGELSGDEVRRIDRLLSRDESLRERLLALERSDEEIRRSHPPDWLVRGIAERARQRRAPPERGRVLSTVMWTVPAALAAFVFLTFRVGGVWAPTGHPPVNHQENGAGDERAKGDGTALVIYRRTDAGSETLSDGDVVRQGDRIRLAYRVAEAGYGAILSIDGNGVVTLHLPVEGTRAEFLEPGKTVLLDRAFELDDAPRAEMFFLVTGRSAFDLAPAIDEVRRATAGGTHGSSATLHLPSLYYVTLSLRKESRP